MIEGIQRVLAGFWQRLQTEWWEGISDFERLFWYIAIPFSVVFLVQLATTFLGLADGGDEGGGAFEGDPGFHLITVRNFIIFFTVFGWTGIVMSQAEQSEGATILLAIAIGLLVMVMVATLFYFVIRLSQSGTMDLRYTEGKEGEVYIPIPGGRGGSGKILIRFQGSLREIDAVTNGPTLARGTWVTVTAIVNRQIALVEAISQKEENHV